jgi:hypothetical protein
MDKNNTILESSTKIAIFKGKEIRKTIHNGEWWFSVADVVEALSDSVDVRQYIKRMRSRDEELNNNWGTICTPLQMLAADGKIRKVNAANTEGVFRIIQSIPSPKAEPFKRWLAKVGYERIQEIENPELASKRIRAIYKAKGYSDDWIEKRMRSEIPASIEDAISDYDLAAILRRSSIAKTRCRNSYTCVFAQSDRHNLAASSMS